ncbi:MAG: uncharacterized protein conserved in archaea [Haloquadratum sp. J07HQX50]|nr:MAG: uncharacterized protein conserved in archaea [Haloquadratum sp. J07HQX50]
MQVSAVIESIWPTIIEILPRVGRITALITIGVFVANIAVEAGLIRRIAAVSKFLTRPANLPDIVGTAIITTAASTTAGYGMLADFRESGRLSDVETLIAVTMNTFFGFIQHVFTFYAPVLIPILGLEVGLLYVGSRAAIALGITVAGIAAGAVMLRGSPLGQTPSRPQRQDDIPPAERHSTVSEAEDTSPLVITEAALRSTWPKIRRIIPRLAIIYVIVTLVIETQDLESITAIAAPLTAVLGLPGAALPVIAVFTFDTTAGAATIAPMVGTTFSPRAAVATMLLGGIISFAVSTFKRSIPFQYGIWGPSFGSKVIIVNTILKVVFILAALAVLLVP